MSSNAGHAITWSRLFGHYRNRTPGETLVWYLSQFFLQLLKHARARAPTSEDRLCSQDFHFGLSAPEIIHQFVSNRALPAHFSSLGWSERISTARPPEGRIACYLCGIVQVFVPSQPAVGRLPERIRQGKLCIPAGAGIHQVILNESRQAEAFNGYGSVAGLG